MINRRERPSQENEEFPIADLILFKGFLKEGKFHSFGMLQTQFFGYCGDYKLGIRHGLGSLNFEDGRKYIGSFEKGIKHGFGYSKEMIQVYWGNYRKDKRHGLGYFKG